MDRFLSNSVNRIDAKGRVSVPAPFRAILSRQPEGDLYGLQNIDMPAVDAGGPDFLQRMEAKLSERDFFDRAYDDLSFYLHGAGSYLKLDQDGRITVTDFIRDHTGITSEVCFVGRGHFFQMWEPERFRIHHDAVRARLLAQRSAGNAT